jgi:hypothetical protein
MILLYNVLHVQQTVISDDYQYIPTQTQPLRY